ncbi:unnamed protein product [Sphagnum balticum]
MSRIKIFGLRYDCYNFNMGMDSMGQTAHILLSLCQWPRLDIKILNDVQPHGSNPDEYSQFARKTMAEILEVPQPDSRFRDKEDFHKILVEEFKNEQSKQQ